MNKRAPVSMPAGALAVLVVAAAFAACGGGSPASPSSSEPVSVEGVVLGVPSASGSLTASSGSTAAAGEVTVSCLENPSITATVGPDGRFTLRGLPAGSFTLVFRQGATQLGTIHLSEVKPNQQITITVSVAGGVVVLVEQKRNGIGHGDLEIEGLVEQVLCGVTGSAPCAVAGESRFLIAGHTVVARPGQTAIREGNTARTVDDVTPGRHVHVKGTWLQMEGSSQPVLALEIKLQDDGDEAGAFTCVASAKAEVEGKIQQSDSTALTLLVFQQGKGLYECLVPSGTPIRKGNATYTFAELMVGWRVHVKGTAQGFKPTAGGEVCQVTASEVKVQNN